ncbi:major facilitator superfamily domain-containing protein [Aspergillus transmontanensis]|uniref:Major facilitator superfamily domain-containing protein n=1 Tax=Aspergillus transmontanensis TaxID=1034304 RepID=A0A5N6WBQ1_9EURO|nr:major facilitator superfamily domain-containing protein [Aspergillus transmontanensis]
MSNIQEKPDASNKEAEVGLDHATDLHRASVGYGEQLMDPSTATTNKSLLRKIDWRLLPIMMLSYMLQFLDKQSLSQAAIMGIIEDLKLTGTEYSWSGSIFYFSYLVFSYPASMLLVRLPIAKVLATTLFLWGVVLACHATTHDFTGIMVTRFFLGLTEAAISPGFSLITGMWYTRSEQPFRHGLWFAGNSLATAFGGLIAYGVAHISGSIPAWKWLFIIYGIITVVWSIVFVLFMPDSPLTARFLSQSERADAEERVKVNQTTIKHDRIQWHQVWEALADYKIYILFLFQVANNIPNGGLTMFSAIVVKGFGFSTLQTYLLAIPTGAVHAFFALGSTYLASRFPNTRSMLLAGCTMIAFIGSIIVYVCESTGVRLFGLYLFVAYAAGIPMTLSMVSSNVAGFTKKATVSAMMFIAYCTGNIVGPFLFFGSEAPVYKSGFIAMMVCLAAATVLILALGLSWRMENARRDRVYGPATLPPRNNPKEPAQGTAGAREDLTDVQNTAFRYVF